MMDQLDSKIAFMRHDPSIDVKRNIEGQRDKEIMEIKAGRPLALVT
jgi:hypothetical protein